MVGKMRKKNDENNEGIEEHFECKTSNAKWNIFKNLNSVTSDK